MIEFIRNRPRIVLPGPLGGSNVNAGCTASFVLSPQMPIGPPYWFGMTANEDLHLVDLRFGDVSIFAGQGMAPSGFWNAEFPDKLVPIQAPPIGPGTNFTVEIHNWSCATMVTSFALWGSPVEMKSDRILGSGGGGNALGRPEPLKIPSDLAYDFLSSNVTPHVPLSNVTPSKYWR